MTEQNTPKINTLHDAKTLAGIAIGRQVIEAANNGEPSGIVRELAEAFALVSGTFTGGPKVDIKS